MSEQEERAGQQAQSKVVFCWCKACGREWYGSLVDHQCDDAEAEPCGAVKEIV